MKILVIDNYDSFVYNLVHMLYHLGLKQIDVIKNDKIHLEKVEFYDKILLSPGPGLPKEAGLMPEIIKNYANRKCILGVCLGHQAIAEFFGAQLKNLEEPLHGIASKVEIIYPSKLFENCPQQFFIGHYHSWVIEKNSIHQNLMVLAIDEYQNIMAIKHKNYEVYGVQFHPESILTEFGTQILSNWIKI